MGFLTGVIFKAAQKVDKKKTVCYFVGGFFCGISEYIVLHGRAAYLLLEYRIYSGYQ